MKIETGMHGSLTSYITGFVLSLALTLIPFGLLMWHIASMHVALSHELLMAVFLITAVLQMLVQLFLFLHLMQETWPRWRLILAALALFVVMVIVSGSLWIMAHLQHPDLSKIYTGDIVTPSHEQD